MLAIVLGLRGVVASKVYLAQAIDEFIDEKECHDTVPGLSSHTSIMCSQRCIPVGRTQKV